MDAQIENAITLAFHPTTPPPLKTQAYDFLNALRADPSAWHICLQLFVRAPNPPDEVVRVVCLEIVNQAVQSGGLGREGLEFVRERLVGYVGRVYGGGDNDEVGRDNGGVQNKITQTLTYLFKALYVESWPGFFDEFRGLAVVDGRVNEAGAMLYLRIVGSVHDEIADIMISRTPAEQKLSSDLKDLIRARDVGKIALTWQEILSRWRELDLGLVEMCLRTIAKWISWIDIAVVIDQSIQSALLELAGQQGQFEAESKEARARDAAIDTFTETVGKKMPARDKVELIRYLNLEGIVGQLVGSPALAELRTTPHYDTDLAETVAKLVNNVVFDLVKVLDTSDVEDFTRSTANELLRAFVPFLLRFFADEYDEICSAVIPSLTDLLTMFRKQAKVKGGLAAEYSEMLRPILDAIILKMKYDETTSWGEEDEGTDEAEFQDLRKRLYVLQQTVAAVDERLYITVLSEVIGRELSRLDSTNDKPNWRDLDLALHEMYLFGELAVRNGGLYQKSAPSSEASQQLLEMMGKMVESGLASHPHPAIQLQYMEICVRYVQFFEHNPSSIPKVLETFVEFVHSKHPKVRLRSWYLFQRFVRHLRGQLGNVASTVIRAVGDLLVVKADLPEGREDDDASSEDNVKSSDAAFQSQLYLFEAVGCVAGTQAVPIETKMGIVKSVVEPLSADIRNNLSTAKNSDARSILQIHHLIMALGTLANRFSDWTPGSTTSTPPPTEVSNEFIHASEAIVLALETLQDSPEIRTASRHAFSRLLGVLGPHVLPQLPRWIDGLLSSTTSNEEMAMFLRALAQVVYGFKAEIHSILSTLLTPLFRRVFTGLALPAAGTDDEIHLRDLKQQFLNFTLVILNNGLDSVLVSPENQPIFVDPFITSLTRFAIDPSDPPAARLAFSALTRMTALWAGPDIPPDSPSPSAPTLPGFDAFVLSHFAPLPWSLLSTPGFSAADAQMRSVLQEAAVLQWTVLRKAGRGYWGRLEGELRSLGAGEKEVGEFGERILGDGVGFRKFFVGFVGRGR